MWRNPAGHETVNDLILLITGALITMTGGQGVCQKSPVPGTPAEGLSIPQAPAYEVTTVKPWDGTDFGMPLRVYIQAAFGIPMNSVGYVVGPSWINSAKYVIQGKPPDSIQIAMRAMSAEGRQRETQLMEQGLLADRFQLKAHFETRQMPVYHLTIAKGGPKLKGDSDLSKSRLGVGAAAIRGTAVPMRAFIDALESVPDIGGHVVIDDTGLSGRYDFSLRWAPMDHAVVPAGNGVSLPTDPQGVSLFAAIEEQLGLKLVAAKGPGRVLVIDHIEKPSEN